MARLISSATGNLTASGTWSLVDSTSFLESEANNTALTTSYVNSSTFTPGAITIDGIAVRIASRATSPTGSMLVRLGQGGATVAGTEVTINVSDLPTAGTTNGEGGWIFFKFAASVTLLAATAYTVGARTTSSTQVNLYRDATAGNWCRMLRRTTNQAPVAGDDLFILGEHTGAGTGNDITVTMDSTAATDYGSASTSQATPAISICKRGTLTYGTTAATNYVLRVSGNMNVYGNGTLNIGTTGTPIPRDSTAVLEFDCAADGDFGLYIRGGTVNMQGLSRTSGKNVVQALLSADEAVASTTIDVDTDTGWLNGDTVVIASTTRTHNEWESRTLNANAGASSFTISSGLTNAHLGTSPRQAEVILLTRNVMVRSVSSTAMSYVQSAGNTTLDIDWVDFRYIGTGVLTKSGVYISGNTATNASFNYCTFRDSESCGGVIATGSTATGTLTVQDCVFHNLNTGAVPMGVGLDITQVTGTINLSNLTIIGGTLNNLATAKTAFYVSLSGSNCTMNNIRITGITIATNTNSSAFTAHGTQNDLSSISNVYIHSNNVVGLGLGTIGSGARRIYLNGGSIWRNNVSGVRIGNGFTNTMDGSTVIDNFSIFGNTTSNIACESSVNNLTLFKNCSIDSDATFSTTNGLLQNNSNQRLTIQFMNCDFGNTVTHTNDINISTTNNIDLTLINCGLASTNKIVVTTSNILNEGFINVQNYNNTANDHRIWQKGGTIVSQTTTRNTASGIAWQMSPISTQFKLRLPYPNFQRDPNFKAAVAASSAVTVTAYVRKNGTYNGNAPRLVLVGGIVEGIGSDVVDSLTVGADTWEQLSVTATPTETGVIEFFIDCDGTAGSVFVDDIAVTQ